QSFNINRPKAAQTIAFAALPNRKVGDPDFTVTANASSGLPVSFAASGSCSVNGTTVHLTGAGTCLITASQAGDTDYLPAADIQRSFLIGVTSAAGNLVDIGASVDVLATQPTAINAYGQVVAATTLGSSQGHAYLWSPGARNATSGA